MPNPEISKASPTGNEQKGKKPTKEFGPVPNKIATILLRPFLYGMAMKHWDNPEYRELLHKNERQGLLEGSILSGKLWRPTINGHHLEYVEGTTGDMIGYDFHRPKKLRNWRNKPIRQHFEGKMYVIDFDENNQYSPDQYTPTGAFDPAIANNVLKMNKLTLGEMLEKGYIEETTYKEAYTKTGKKTQYSAALIEIGEQSVYRVTQKGNSVVHISPEGGDKRKSPKEAQSRNRRKIMDIFPGPAPVPA